MRFFKERRIPVSFIDVAQRAPAPGELRRFVDRFGADALVDRDSRAYRDLGLGYLRMDGSELQERVLGNPSLLRLPLVRSGSDLAIGQDEPAWLRMAAAGKTAT